MNNMYKNIKLLCLYSLIFSTPLSGLAAGTGGSSTTDTTATDTPTSATGDNKATDRGATGRSATNKSTTDTSPDRAGTRIGDDRLPTASDNSNVDMTQKIRQELMKNDDLSTRSQNVAIIVENNMVTLRGQVANTTEKTKTESTVRRVASNMTIRNEIVVDKTE